SFGAQTIGSRLPLGRLESQSRRRSGATRKGNRGPRKSRPRAPVSSSTAARAEDRGDARLAAVQDGIHREPRSRRSAVDATRACQSLRSDSAERLAAIMKDVVIIGGGISGLTLAYHLQKMGLDIAVLEGSDRLGGNVRTLSVDGFLLELGPNSSLA